MRLLNCKIVGKNIDPAIYHNHLFTRGSPDFPMSRGQLMNFASCPARWIAGYESKDTDATDWGSLMDTLILTPAEFGKRYAVTPMIYRNDKGEEKPWNWNSNVCKKWREDRAWLECLKPEFQDEALNALDRFKQDKQAWQMVSESDVQMMVTGVFKASNGVQVPVRCLLDLVPRLGTAFEKSLGDLKTSVSAAPGKWARACFQHGYHVQDALSLDLYTAATGEDRIEFRHVIQESFPPYQTGRRILSQELIDLGRNTYIANLDFYAQCLQSNTWPDYDQRAGTSLDGWSLTQPEPWMMTVAAADLPELTEPAPQSTLSEMPS